MNSSSFEFRSPCVCVCARAYVCVRVCVRACVCVCVIVYTLSMRRGEILSLLKSRSSWSLFHGKKLFGRRRDLQSLIMDISVLFSLSWYSLTHLFMLSLFSLSTFLFFCFFLLSVFSYSFPYLVRFSFPSSFF